MLPHLSYLTLALATASTISARQVNVARGKLNMIPKFSYDPETSKNCVWWLDNDDGSWTCSEVGRAYELSMVDFQRWNPILNLPCGTLNKTQSYCIAATEPRAAIDTVTVEVTRLMGWNTTRPRTSSSLSTPQPVTVALPVPTTLSITITVLSTTTIPVPTTISVPTTVSERTTIPSPTTVSIRTTISIPTTLTIPPTTITSPTTTTETETEIEEYTITPLTTVTLTTSPRTTTTSTLTTTIAATTTTQRTTFFTATVTTTRWWTWYETLATVTVPAPNSTLRREQIVTPIPHQPDMVDYCRYFHLMKRGHSCLDLADWFHVSQADLVRWNAPREGVCEELIRDYYVCVGGWE